MLEFLWSEYDTSCMRSVQAEETRTGPMCAGDRLRNLGKRGIGFPDVFETVLRDRDCVCPAAPFSHELRSRSDISIAIGGNAPVGCQLFG